MEAPPRSPLCGVEAAGACILLSSGAESSTQKAISPCAGRAPCVQGDAAEHCVTICTGRLPCETTAAAAFLVFVEKVLRAPKDLREHTKEDRALAVFVSRMPNLWQARIAIFACRRACLKC